MYDEILYNVDDPVATITLNRPQALNAWTDRMAAEVRHAVGRAAQDKAVVGIVITGAGRAFCAGADMNMLSGLTEGERLGTAVPEELRADPADPTFGPDFGGQYTYLMAVPKPIIAAINGPIAGMAVPIALSCDLRFMAEDAILLTAFSQRGLIAEWGVSWLLSRLVGPATAMDLLFSSRRVDGVEAAKLGVVNAAVPAGSAYEHSRQYIEDLARTCSPESIAVMKRQINQQTHAGLGSAEAEAFSLMVGTFASPQFKEGVRSFLERRPPNFPRVGGPGD